jgi:hypothetical protein
METAERRAMLPERSRRCRLTISRDRRRSMKGQQKPKQLAKKAPQKTLKERRAGKKAAAKDKRSSSGL